MKSVAQRDTSAEVAARKLLHAMGVRFRVYNRDLPGTPDIANRTNRWAIFVNGCFWHGHKNCAKTKSGPKPRVPVANRSYWGPKFDDNRRRDARKCRALRARGYRVAIVWECELMDLDAAAERFERFLARPTRRPRG